jgi:hypothetical protein
MDGMIGGVGEEDRRGEGEQGGRESKGDGNRSRRAKQQRIHSHELLIPANYLLTAALSLVIPLPVYHHSLYRWEQSLAICESPSHPPFSHTVNPTHPHIHI